MFAFEDTPTTFYCYLQGLQVTSFAFEHTPTTSWYFLKTLHLTWVSYVRREHSKCHERPSYNYRPVIQINNQ